VSEYDGWILPTPLFNRLTPCFRDVLEHPPADEPIDHKVFTPPTDWPEL
jgi:hypothetical protein